MRPQADDAVAMNDPERGQEVLPVVALHFRAGLSAEQDQAQRPGVGHIDRDVEHVLSGHQVHGTH